MVPPVFSFCSNNCSPYTLYKNIYSTVFDVFDSLSPLRLDSTFWCCMVFQHIDVQRLFQAAENTQHGLSMRFSSVMASRGCIDQGTSGTSSGVVEHFEWTMVENSSTNTEIVLG